MILVMGRWTKLWYL